MPPVMRGPDAGAKRALSRRDFVRAGGCLLAVGALGAAGGCAAVLVRVVEPVDGRLELAFNQYPELTERDGALRVQVPGSEVPIYVLVTGEREFAVLSPVCTHLGCTVEIEGRQLVCPCHGSTYDRAGQVLRGPAERALSAYRWRTTADDVLVIDLGPTRGRNG